MLSVSTQMRRLVIIESPYASSPAANEKFAEAVCRWAIVERSVVPFASHLFFTRFLNDKVTGERRTGIEAGYRIGELADEIWFCLREDEGLSRGMNHAMAHYVELKRPIFMLTFHHETYSGIFHNDKLIFISKAQLYPKEDTDASR